MLKLMIGVKGTGKTKTLIEKVNAASATSHGDVVCIEKGTKLRFDVSSKVRLVDTEEYLVSDAQALYGLIAGILASNYDVTDIFVDNTLKICNGNIPALEMSCVGISLTPFGAKPELVKAIPHAESVSLP